MAGVTGLDAGRERLLRAQRSLFIELGRRIFRLRPRDPRAAREALAAIGRRAFLDGWSRHHPDLLPLHQRLLRLEAALDRVGRDERRGRAQGRDRGKGRGHGVKGVSRGAEDEHAEKDDTRHGFPVDRKA